MTADAPLALARTWDQIIAGELGWKLMEDGGWLYRGPSLQRPMQIWEPAPGRWARYPYWVALPSGRGRYVTAGEAKAVFGPRLHLDLVCDFGTGEEYAPPPPLTLLEIEERIMPEASIPTPLWLGTALARRQRDSRSR